MCSTQTMIVIGLFAIFMAGLYILMAKPEGFVDLNVSPSLFVPLVTPGGNEEESALSPAGTHDVNVEKILASAVPEMPTESALQNFGNMTSEKCYRSDIGESLKKTRNYLQRTNNYKRIHPDDCSAPNHELIGTFYTPFDGVGRNPASGTNYPKSTQPCN